jgi:hypothetical protein
MKTNKTKKNRLNPGFLNETRVDITKVPPPVPFRAQAEDDLEKLKSRLLNDKLWANETGALNPEFRRAANEAAALAWLSPLPLLVFPELFEEKVNSLLARWERQNNIRLRSQAVLEEAA